MLNYILVVIISFLGLLVGSLLVFMASEEQKPGKKYFIFVQNVILTLIVALLMFFYNLNVYVVIIISLIIFALSYYIKNAKRTYSLYPLFGVFFYIVLNEKIFLTIMAILVFIYGLVTAFLLVNVKDKKTIFKVVVNHSTFLLTALLPFFISYF